MFVTWLDYVMFLFQGGSVVITAGLVLFGIPILRDQLLNHNPALWKHFLVVMLFSLLAIYGTHAGKAISMTGGLESVDLTHALKPNQAVVNFRDMVVVTAGLALGPWTGLLVGGIAGLERYALGGFTALACSLMSVLSGLMAGLIRRYNGGMLSPFKAAGVGAMSIIIQMSLILILSKPFSDAWLLVKHTGIPMLAITVAGCYAFQQVMRGLDKVRLQLLARKTKIRAQQAEIRALNAQIEPHFLMNTLNAINALIRIDRERARYYVTMLGEFLHETRSYATQNTISIKDELCHIDKYLEFQYLRFSEEIQYDVQIESPDMLEYKIPPRSLLTLIENSLVHGFSDRSQENSIVLRIHLEDNKLIITVEDNGMGVKQEKIQEIGNRPVASDHKKGGYGLYCLKKTLNRYYGEKSDLKIDAPSDKTGTVIQLSIPVDLKLKGLPG
ncbi:MAG TPA: hypothetical protein ENJ08_15725 [Gammaproteobacteria bacterium]|nr:hypothetical protein [Gammaproteobacteria bacterium]